MLSVRRFENGWITTRQGRCIVWHQGRRSFSRSGRPQERAKKVLHTPALLRPKDRSPSYSGGGLPGERHSYPKGSKRSSVSRWDAYLHKSQLRLYQRILLGHCMGFSGLLAFSGNAKRAVLPPNSRHCDLSLGQQSSGSRKASWRSVGPVSLAIVSEGMKCVCG